MSAASNYLENALIDHVLRNTTFTSPTTVYVALFTNTATPAELESGTLTNEVTGGSYARQAATFDAPSNGTTQNTTSITFASMPTVVVDYFAIMDASSAGNVLVHGTLDATKNVDAGDSLIFEAGNLTVTLA